MSVSLSLLTENYSLIATDTRATFKKPKNGAKWEDNCKKIFLAPFGWVAQQGGVSGSKIYFEECLDKYNIKSRKDIYTCFLMGHKKLDEFLENRKSQIEGLKIITSTSTITYSLNYFKDGLWNMSVETIDFMFKLRKLKDKNTLIVNPPKSTKRINRLIEEYQERVKHAQDIHESIYLIACFMHELSKLSKLVNNHVECGISYKLSDTELIYMKVSKNAKEIKKLYKEQKDLSSIMMVIDKL